MAKNPPKYFAYNEYINVKKALEYERTDKIDVSFANYIISSIPNTRDKELKLRETFCELKKLVQRHHCFYEPGPETCCNYINYWLNKTVRDSKYGINKDNFKYFDEFMKIDPKIKENSTYCISELSYMDNESFEKMKKLYDLYDYFTELKKRDDLSSLCHNISDIAMKYESVLQECNGKDNLWDKLSNLRHVISRDQLVAKNICTKNTFDSYFLKMHPTPREESTAPKIVQAQVQHRNHGKAYTAPTVSVPLPQRHGRKSVETPPPPQVTVPSSRAHGRDSVQTSTPTPVSVSLSQAPVLEEQVREESKQTLSVSPELIQLPLARTLSLPLPSLESSETEETDVYARPRGITESETEPELELQQEQPQEQGYRPGHDVYPFSKDGRYIYPEAGYPSAGSMQSTFDTGTIMGTIKGAVSNVLEAVEPVPVLGVSGGMGALYLLLKYTPIGSLFRRNRRNNQNIPNFFDPRYGEQFSGYYPQYYNEGFPNYRMNIAYHPSSEELD